MNMQKFTQQFLLIFVFTFLAFNFNSLAQKNEQAIENAKLKYKKSIQYNDIQQAKSAIYDLMALEPMNASYLDSLAYIYYDFSQFASAALVSRDALKRNPNNQLMLQISAKSLDNLGAKEQSLKAYQKLYNISDDPYVLYEIVQKQYGLGMYDDAMINIELLYGKGVVNGSSVYALDTTGKEIEVPFKAVILNLKGLISRGQGDEKAAKKYFDEAIKLAPTYALPQENLNPKE